MNQFIDLFLKFLPKQAEQIKLLQFVPDAVDTVKETIALVNRMIELIKREKITDEQRVQLKKFVEEDWKTLEHWKLEA